MDGPALPQVVRPQPPSPNLLPSKTMPVESKAIHQSAVVIDGHADTPQRILDDRWHFTDPLGTGMLNLDSARAGNLAAEFFAAWANPPHGAAASPSAPCN